MPLQEFSRLSLQEGSSLPSFQVHDEALQKDGLTQTERAAPQQEAVVERGSDEAVELPLLALHKIFQMVNSDTGNKVLICMEVCKEWHAAVMVTALKLRLFDNRRPWEALLKISKFEGLCTLYVEQCELRGSIDNNILAFQALGRRCPHLTAIHFIKVGLGREEAASLFSYCSTICTLELTDLNYWFHNFSPARYRQLQTSFVDTPHILPVHILTRLTTLVLTQVVLVQIMPPIDTLSLLQSLHITGWKLFKALPPLSGLPFLRHLNASHCRSLEELNLAYSPALESLTVTECASLRKIAGLEVLTSLHTLKACGCHELNLGTNLTSIRSLQAVAFDVKHNSQIQPLEAMPRLRNLYLSINNIQVSLDALRGIEDLSVRVRRLDALPSLANLHGLRSLELSHVRDLGEMKHISTLQQLKIDGCVAGHLPPLSHLSQLQMITVSFARQHRGEVPRLDGLANLTSITFSNCLKIENLPWLDETLNLQHLHLESCNFKSLPPIGHLHRLTHLNVSGCTRLKSLPPLPHSLQTLKFTDCMSLSEIPSLDRLLDLQHLVGTGSGISKLPPLSGLVSLRVLELQFCKNLVDVPEIGGVLSMRTLLLSYCEMLEQVPPLAKLRRLRLVDVYECPRLENLQFLDGVHEEVRIVCEEE